MKVSGLPRLWRTTASQIGAASGAARRLDAIRRGCATPAEGGKRWRVLFVDLRQQVCVLAEIRERLVVEPGQAVSRGAPRADR